jgi:hypothetical protein
MGIEATSRLLGSPNLRLKANNRSRTPQSDVSQRARTRRHRDTVERA